VNFTILQTDGEHFIHGTVFHDINKNAVKNSCEAGIEGVTVNLTTSEDVVLDSFMTGAGGYYAFAVTVSGDYRVVEIDPDGYFSTTSNTVAITVAQQDVTVTFGDLALLPTYTVCGTVYEDIDGNGDMETGEQGIAGVAVALEGVSDILTDSIGGFAFAVTVTGPYAVSVTEPEGFMSTTANPADIVATDAQTWVNFGLRRYVDVPVDVKPGSDINPVNLRSRGVLPVAILGNGELDVNMINPETILLNSVAPLRWSIEDVCGDDYITEKPDGFNDLTLKFDTQEIAATLGEPARGDIVTLSLSGEMYDMTALVGEENILIVQVPK
jgi:hypothetical protein